ncbi:hypothetical protein D3C73_737860 [compost metagenome]
MVVPPSCSASPVRISVPAPSLVRAPAPAIGPASSNVVPLSVSTVPAPARVTFRAEAMLDVVLSVPPSRVNPPAASPRLASFEMRTVPPSISVPPV